MKYYNKTLLIESVLSCVVVFVLIVFGLLFPMCWIDSRDSQMSDFSKYFTIGLSLGYMFFCIYKSIAWYAPNKEERNTELNKRDFWQSLFILLLLILNFIIAFI